MNREELQARWEALGPWQPLAAALLAILLLAILHYGYWFMTAETDPGGYWASREIERDGDVWILYLDDEPGAGGSEVGFRGTLVTSPRFSVYENGTIKTGIFSPVDGLVYTEDLYGKTMLNLSGMPILIHGNVSGQFFANEIVTIRATKVNDTTNFTLNGENMTLIRQGWEAQPEDIALVSQVDRWFFGSELLALIAGVWLTVKRRSWIGLLQASYGICGMLALINALLTQNVLVEYLAYLTALAAFGMVVWLPDQLRPVIRREWEAALHIARFEAHRGLRSPRTIVLVLFFTLFIVGMGWLLGDLQKGENALLGGVQNPNDALGQLAWFTFFVTALAAVAVSLDSFVAERDSGTLPLLLAQPLRRETVVLGKALGLWLSIGLPALAAQLLGLALMLREGGQPAGAAIAGYLLLGQLMILTFVLLQLCLAIVARTGAEAAVYGLLVWLLVALVWPLLFLAAAYALGIDVTMAGYEQDPAYQSVVSHMGLLNPGYVYQMGVGLLAHRTFAVDFEGVSGWQVASALLLWPLACLALAAWLFRREERG